MSDDSWRMMVSLICCKHSKDDWDFFKVPCPCKCLPFFCCTIVIISDVLPVSFKFESDFKSWMSISSRLFSDNVHSNAGQWPWTWIFFIRQSVYHILNTNCYRKYVETPQQISGHWYYLGDSHSKDWIVVILKILLTRELIWLRVTWRQTAGQNVECFCCRYKQQSESIVLFSKWIWFSKKFAVLFFQNLFYEINSSCLLVINWGTCKYINLQLMSWKGALWHWNKHDDKKDEKRVDIFWMIIFCSPLYRQPKWK